MSETLFAVITSIHPPTACTRHLVERLASTSGAADVLIVGDAKGPASYELDGARLIDLETQHAMPFALASLLPTGHYARKNLGYLEAIRQGADCIYETDDDNEPGPTWAVNR